MGLIWCFYLYNIFTDSRVELIVFVVEGIGGLVKRSFF